MQRMSRRQMLDGAGAVGLGLLGGCLPLSWQNRAPTRMHRVGFLGDAPSSSTETFREALRELGYVEGENLVLEWRWFGFANRDFSHLDALAVELTGLGVDVIATMTTPGALAARRATDSIPNVLLQATEIIQG